MTKSPVFSIVICCYNSENYIKETIDSVINQSFKEWELVIINDGSTDKTEEIVKEYIDQGININYRYQQNKGFASGRNKAFEIANGKWIGIIDHDDLCLPNRFEEHYKDISKNLDADLFFSDAYHIDENGSELKKHFDIYNPKEGILKKKASMNELLAKGCYINSQTVVVKKEAALSIGMFNEKYKYIVDYDFFLRLSDHYNIHCNNLPLSKWRSHPGQATKNLYMTVLYEHLLIYMKYFLKRRVNLMTKLIIFLKSLKIIVKILLGSFVNFFKKN